MRCKKALRLRIDLHVENAPSGSQENRTRFHCLINQHYLTYFCRHSYSFIFVSISGHFLGSVAQRLISRRYRRKSGLSSARQVQWPGPSLVVAELGLLFLAILLASRL